MNCKRAYYMPMGILVLLVFLTACEEVNRDVRFYPPAYQNVDAVALQGIFEERSGILMGDAPAAQGMTSLEALVAGKADLAIVENTTPFTQGVRAVLPVYQSVLHVLVHDSFAPANPDKPLQGATINIVDNSAAGNRVIKIVTRRQGLGPDDFTITTEDSSKKADLILYFGPVNPDNTDWFVPGYSLVSLDNRLNPQRELYREGLAYIDPKLHSMVIPPLTYDLPGNEKPILSVSADTLLVARRDLSVSLVYMLTRALIEQKPRFTAIAPHLFSGITEAFDPLDLNFPLHAGARRYLHRDEPGVLERYAESINLLVYLVFLILSAVVALMRWRLHRKKNRIDQFYIQALGIEERADGKNSAELLLELRELEQEAFRWLIAEKLAANESFRIFTDLLLRIRADLLK
ncbi:MAG: hypothetical protein IMF06_02400 [Proteobacteria bacterium]|nr:hypothetical protein [Pseudomonadota bacterium]